MFVGLLILILVPRLRHHVWRWGKRAALVAALGALVVGAADWLFGGRYISVSGNVWWPPYLRLPVVGIALGVGMIVFFAGRAWGRSSRPGFRDVRRCLGSYPAKYPPLLAQLVSQEQWRHLDLVLVT